MRRFSFVFPKANRESVFKSAATAGVKDGGKRLSRMGQSSLFYKYLVSYAVILILPLLLTGFFLYKHFVGILQEEVMKSNEQLTAQAAETLDGKMKEMNKIAVEISAKPELSPYRLTADMYNAMLGKPALHYPANDFIEEVLLYIRGNPYLYSAASTYSVPRFINDIMPFANWSEEAFLHDIEHVQTPVLRRAEAVGTGDTYEKKMITYVVPIPVNSPQPYGTVLFLIEESKVVRLLRGVVHQENSNVVILNGKDEVIASLMPDDYLHSAEFRAYIGTLGVKSSDISALNGADYVVSAVKSAQTGWKYATIIPLKSVMAKVNDVKQRSLLVLLLILTAGTAIIYAVMRFNYQPVRRLLAFSGESWGTAVRNLNELTAGIERMAEKSRQLSVKLESSHSAVREYMLLNLLKGRIAGVEDWKEQALEAGIAFTKPYYFVMLVAVRGMAEMEPRDRAELTNALELRLLSMMEGYRIELAEDEYMTFICTAEEPEEELQRALVDFRRQVAEQWEFQMTISVGNRYGMPEQIGKSYIEAATAMNYRMVKGQNTVIRFNDVMTDQKELRWYPKQEIERLELYIRQGNMPQIDLIVNDILRRMEHSGMSLYIAQCICYDMINTVIKTLYSLNDKVPQVESAYPDVLRMSKYDTIQDYAKIVLDLCGDLSRNIREQGNKEWLLSVDECMAYLHDRYQDPAFSVQAMADHFAVSVSHMQRTFKEQAGQTITDYLNYIRIKRAKELLRACDMQIKDIVQQLGYYDVSSFIRKFKQAVGMTPGEYRKLYGEKGDGAEGLQARLSGAGPDQ